MVDLLDFWFHFLNLSIFSKSLSSRSPSVISVGARDSAKYLTAVVTRAFPFFMDIKFLLPIIILRCYRNNSIISNNTKTSCYFKGGNQNWFCTWEVWLTCAVCSCYDQNEADKWLRSDYFPKVIIFRVTKCFLFCALRKRRKNNQIRFISPNPFWNLRWVSASRPLASTKDPTNGDILFRND